MATMSSNTFKIERMQLHDFGMMLTPSHRRGGDLTTPVINGLSWPVRPGEDDEALARLEYSVQQQKKLFQVDPTAHFIKAVDQDGTIAGIVRWNFYPRGYAFEVNDPVDVEEFLPDGWEKRFNLKLWKDLREHEMRARKEWIPDGQPCWIGMSMIVRQCYRKSGIATQLVDWALERGRKDGIPVYLEASAEGDSVFRSLGCQQIGDFWSWDCKPYGVDLVLREARMAYYPPSVPSVGKSDSTSSPTLRSKL